MSRVFLLGLANAIYDRERGKWKLRAQIRVTLSEGTMQFVSGTGLFQIVRGVTSESQR